MRVLFIILIILIILKYIQFYSSFNNNYHIIQSQLYNIDYNQLNEKYPIVISDRIINPDQLLTSLFRYNYVFKTETFSRINNVILNTAKYSILFNNKEDYDINLITPSYRKSIEWRKKYGHVVSFLPLTNLKLQMVTIKMKQYQVLILPPFWLYQCDKKIKRIGLNDPFSKLYESVYKISFKIMKD
jgi:hypothetical protein